MFEQPLQQARSGVTLVTLDGVPKFLCAFPRSVADGAPHRCGTTAYLLASIRSGVADFDPNLFGAMANVVKS